jgi:DNA-binding GntR family transcriptional regulator
VTAGRTDQEKITELLRDRFERGEFAPRRRIPSQAEMAEDYGVSGRTIAIAIARLRRQGYLWTLPHKGSYARPRKDWGSPGEKPAG